MAAPDSVPVMAVASHVSLQDLSDETILDIFESGPLGRDELALVCLACKRLRRIAIALLYKEINISGDLSFHRLLRSILRNDSLGELIKNLTLDWYGHRDEELFNPVYDTDGNYRYRSRVIDVEEVEGLAAAVGSRPIDPEIAQYLGQGSESAKVIVLVSSLPNLQVLSVQPPSTTKLFDTHFASLATSGRSFPNLKQFERLWYDSEDGLELRVLFPVMLIPSLTTMWGYTVCNGLYNFDLEDHPGDGTSNVTHLALDLSKLTGEELSSILRIPKALEYFSFTEGDANVACGYPTREEFGAALACTSQTLVSLVVEWEDDLDYDDTTLGSLRDFERLRILSIDFDVLLGIDPDEAVDLASVLPQTIEQLFFVRGHNGSWKDVDYLRSIERLIRAKSTWSFTELTIIAIQPEPGLLAPLLDFAAEKGITLASYDPRWTRYQSKTFEIQWYPLSEEMIK